jgi:hypothetical protein
MVIQRRWLENLTFDDHGHNDYDFWQTNIGKPLEKYVKIEANLYKRKYDNGYVIYNGTNVAKEVSFEGTVILVLSIDGKTTLNK